MEDKVVPSRTLFVCLFVIIRILPQNHPFGLAVRPNDILSVDNRLQQSEMAASHSRWERKYVMKK